MHHMSNISLTCISSVLQSALHGAVCMGSVYNWRHISMSTKNKRSALSRLSIRWYRKVLIEHRGVCGCVWTARESRAVGHREDKVELKLYKYKSWADLMSEGVFSSSLSSVFDVTALPLSVWYTVVVLTISLNLSCPCLSSSLSFRHWFCSQRCVMALKTLGRGRTAHTLKEDGEKQEI